jgi:DNA-binding ferritin-like protein
MLKTRRPLQKRNTRKRRSSSQSFEQEVTLVFMETLVMVKLFHWKTHSFATHKATDELYSSLNEHFDDFIEVLLGKTGDRINLTRHKSIPLIDLDSQDKLKSKMESFINYLASFSNNKTIMNNTDLLNIRDEILGDVNKFLYLLTFK